MKKQYMDKEENIQCGDQYLEEITFTNSVNVNPQNDALTKILEQLMENSKQNQEQSNMRKAADRLVLEKFGGKNTNAIQWMESFEKECERFNISQDEKKIEMLRFFLEKTGSDWHSSMLIKHTLDSEWQIWKNNFCETFGNKGWAPIKYALSFKYKEGSLLDYAIKKEKLLPQARKTIDTGTLLDLIASGLPDFICDKIDREKLEASQDLFNEINKLEHFDSQFQT